MCSTDDYVHRIGRTGRCGNVGTAIAFLNERSSNIVRELIDLLVEAKQEVPSWMHSLSVGSRRGGGGKRRGGGGGNFGARDYRQGSSSGASYGGGADSWSRGGVAGGGSYSSGSQRHNDAW